MELSADHYLPSAELPSPEDHYLQTAVEVSDHLFEEWYSGTDVPILEEERPFSPEVEVTTELADTTQATDIYSEHSTMEAAYESHLETEAWTEAAIEEIASTSEFTQGVSQQWADIGVFLEHGVQEEAESDIDTERVTEEFFQQQRDDHDANHHASWEDWFNTEWEQDAE